MKRIIKLFPVLIIVVNAAAQPSVSGPGCVTPGTTYQYILGGIKDSVVSGQFCISGGVFADDSSKSCFNSKNANLIKVIWNQDATSGSLNFSSPGGNTSITVKITPPLDGGSIDTVIGFQILAKISKPRGISCSPAKGGSCSPLYDYQWQQSDNRLSWSDIKGATGTSLNFSDVSSGMLFYRRQVTEKGSGTVAYSGIATVVVEEAPKNILSTDSK